MLCVNVQAPFAVFRVFAAGSFRPTAGFITPSAAYGLILNIAGIEMRKDGQKPMTLIKSGLPKTQIALGALRLPLLQSVYQQLHNYPVGDSGKNHAPYTKGNKYNIAPASRSFLSDFQAYLCIDGNDELESQIVEGLECKRPGKYGLPFLGDNNFLIDRLEAVVKPEPAYWFVRIKPDNEEGLRDHTTRLTISIDREDMSKTVSALFAPTFTKEMEIPQDAWVVVGY